MTAAPTPAVLGDLTLLEKLAEGGMAEVYLGCRAQPPGVVAVKCLHGHLAGKQQYVDMFLSEGQVATLLQHPNIVRTFEAGHSAGRFYITMEYLSGCDLRDLVRYLAERDQRLPIPAAVWVLERILAALDHAHDVTDDRGQPLQLVNRDVSPTNVVLTFDGAVKLIDFGIAQTTLGFTTQIGHIKGKIAYMSPEQVRGLPVDRRSDVFSAGIVLHELLTGRRLFSGDSDFALMEAVRTGPVSPPSVANSLVDPALDAIVASALQRPRDKRYATAAAFGEALQSYRRERGFDYAPAELAELLGRAFAQRRADDQLRIERARAGASCTEAAAVGRLGGQRTESPAVRRERRPAAVTEPPRSKRRSVLPVMLGILLGLVVSGLMYWLVLGGLFK